MKLLALDPDALGVESFPIDGGAAFDGADAIGITRYCTYTCP